MEEIQNIRISDMRRMFPKWSHGTLYNRLKSLDIKDNKDYMIKNETTGIILYNSKAISLLKKVYLEEFTNNTEADREQLNSFILSFLSTKDISSSLGNSNRDQAVKNDNVDNQEELKAVNLAYINENYVSKEYHNEIIENLNKRIADLEEELKKEKEEKENKYILKEQHNEVVASINKQVELVTSQLDKMTEIVHFKEKKDLFVEQQKIVKIEDGSQKISWWRRLFPKKENIEQ